MSEKDIEIKIPEDQILDNYEQPSDQDDKNLEEESLLQEEQDHLVEELKSSQNTEDEEQKNNDSDIRSVQKLLKICLAGIVLIFVFILGWAVMSGGTAKQSTLIKVGQMSVNQHDSIMALQQKVSDLSDSVNSQISQLKAGQQVLNKGMKNLGSNQQNIVDMIHNQKIPDLSKIEKSLGLIKKELSHQGTVHHVSDKTENNQKNGDYKVVDADLSYVATTPNGAILKVSSNGTNKYITVVPGDHTAYGNIDFVSSKLVKLNGKEIVFDAPKAVKFRLLESENHPQKVVK